MMYVITAIIVRLMLPSALFASSLDGLHLPPPDGDARIYFNDQVQKRLILTNKSQLSDFEEILATGQRVYQWLDHENKSRSASEQLSLVLKPDVLPQGLSPVRLTNEESILASYETLKQEIPDWLGNVIFARGPFPDALPVTDSEFQEEALKVTKIYASASRWQLQRSFLPTYISRAATDVRGYLHLSRDLNLHQNLTNWASLNEADQSHYAQLLVILCQNSKRSASSCAKTFKNAKDKLDFYRQHEQQGLENYNSFFTLVNPRGDTSWSSREQTPSLTVPFLEPKQPDIAEFVQASLESFWQLPPWQLLIEFKARGSHAQIRFQAGATPHVNGLGSNIITMDANTSTTDPYIRWVMAHEFGHVLGLPDCYIEFFDRETDFMVYYNIDLSDAMCATWGEIKEHHLTRLREAYSQSGNR